MVRSVVRIHPELSASPDRANLLPHSMDTRARLARDGLARRRARRSARPARLRSSLRLRLDPAETEDQVARRGDALAELPALRRGRVEPATRGTRGRPRAALTVDPLPVGDYATTEGRPGLGIAFVALRVALALTDDAVRGRGRLGVLVPRLTRLADGERGDRERDGERAGESGLRDLHGEPPGDGVSPHDNVPAPRLCPCAARTGGCESIAARGVNPTRREPRLV